MFQSTFPHGERPGRIIPQKGEWMFQSTFPHGERPWRIEGTLREFPFQSTFPHGERHPVNTRDSRFYGFNPRSHTGNDSAPSTFSIISGCFNPRSHTGNDLTAWRKQRRKRLFQSTFPHGERRQKLEEDARKIWVSIHVPTRGTTLPFARFRTVCRCFNPRSHTGNDAAYK